MKANVYTDAGLERYAGRFVWLSLNTEDAKNAAFLRQYPIPALPTMLVLDATRDEVTLRFVGAATVPQLAKLLDEASQKYDSRSQSAADQLLVRADRAASAGQNTEAAKLFEQALKTAPKKWKNFGRTAEGLVFAYSIDGQDERCAVRSLELYPRVKGTLSAATVAPTGLSCAVGLPADNKKRAELLDKLEKATKEVFDDAKIVISDDDRSGLYLALIDARDAAGDDEGVVALKTKWLAFLEDAAVRAKDPAARTVFDSHRMTAYLDLSMPEKAVPMLEQSEKDFPDDYNPPARLAVVYRELKQYDKALAASDRAIAKSYGPRKLNVFTARADIYVAMGDPKAAKETLTQAIDFAKALPEGQRSDRRIAALEKRLASMQ